LIHPLFFLNLYFKNFYFILMHFNHFNDPAF